ncbi:DUF4288 domain-containing protein [Pedobacter sp. GR22-6]|uniref:DUF4288 domain-containing protein n=1 Tax=Pedobacter sp. GR22-6 TaxID=3127957 RepID=UPI00307DB9D7
MKWFLVKYIYEIISGVGTYKAQFDEQLRLIKALSFGDAFGKAEGLAQGFHMPFTNYKGETVQWKFVGIADMYEIEYPGDGAEVSSVVHEPNDVQGFLNYVDQRRVFLINRLAMQELQK